MTTEERLIQKYGAVVPLSEICQATFGMSAAVAQQAAGRNELPIPTFKLRDSQRAPRLVTVADLAAYIDTQIAESRESWQRSQV